MDSAVFVIIGTIIGSLISIVPNRIMHRERRVDRYLFALVEKKFVVAQEAYNHSLVLSGILNKKDEVKGTVLEPIRNWYNDNCLYLEPEIRAKFREVVDDNWNYHSLRESFYLLKDDEGETKNVQKMRDQLKDVFSSIVTLTSDIEDTVNQYYHPL